MHVAFCQAEIPTYHAVQLRSAHMMLISLLQELGNYASHFLMFVVLFVLPIVYDYEPEAKDDHVVDAITRYKDLVVGGLARSDGVNGNILSPLTATWLVSWCYIQAIISQMHPGRP